MMTMTLGHFVTLTSQEHDVESLAPRSTNQYTKLVHARQDAAQKAILKAGRGHRSHALPRNARAMRYLLFCAVVLQDGREKGQNDCKTKQVY